MSLLTEYAKEKKSKRGILKIAKEAEAAKAINPSIINATIGMLMDEAGELLAFNSVEESIASLSNKEKFAYSNVPGTKEFRESVVDWVFGDLKDEALDGMYVSCLPMPGGTGGISTVFKNYLNPGDKIALPETTWENYKQIAYEVGLSYETYPNLDESNKFNLRDLKKLCIKEKNEQGRVVIVINDPCHNPTGYSMSYEEWISLVIFINELAQDGKPVVLLYDLAYIDYDKRGLSDTRKIFRMFKNFKPNVMTAICFSGSKTLGLYGLRIGALLGYCSDKNHVMEFYDSSQYTIRGTWSTTTTLGISVVSDVFTNRRQEFIGEQAVARDLTVSRSEAFVDEAEKCELETLPFKSGFFISIPCGSNERANIVADLLIKKDVYIVPMDNILRVAICSINLEESKRLPKIIKEALLEVSI